MKRIFTVPQTARGICSTIARGDWTLAVQRVLSEPDPPRRAGIVRAIEKQLDPEDLATWRRYWRPE